MPFNKWNRKQEQNIKGQSQLAKKTTKRKNCPMCGTNISGMNPAHQMKHINRCSGADDDDD